MLPDPWSTPVEYPQSPLYTSQVTPNAFERLMNISRQAGQKAREFGATASTRGRQAAQAVRTSPGLYGTLGAAGVLGGSQLLQGNIPGAVSSTLGGLAGGGLGGLAGKFLPGPLKLAAPLVGSVIGGLGAEQLTAAALGKTQDAAQRPGGGTDVEIAGVPLTETAALRRQREFDRAQQLQDIQQLGGAELALNKELLGYMMTQEVQQAKAMAPIIERAQRAQMTNAQAMINTQTAAYQQLGRTAMMGKLAAIGQQERGATMRQALASNPYIGATLQAPQINMG